MAQEPPSKRQRCQAGQRLPPQWIGTWNNYHDDDIERFRQWCLANTSYSVCGKEVGESGTPHLQSFHQNKRLGFAKFKTLFPTVDITPVDKDNGAADYCKKEGNIAFETGTYVPKNRGRRTDLEALAAAASSGATMKEIADKDPLAVVQYGAGLQRLCSLYEKPRDWTTAKEVIVLWGPTGTGKTRRAFTECENPYIWDPDMKSWFDGYSGQKHVIFDEFRGQLPMGTMLRLLDRYPCRVQYKGGSAQFVADKIYITSPKHPKTWYSDQDDDRVSQLMRRISEIVHMC